MQVVRLKQAIRLVKEIADMRAAKLAARERDRSDHSKLYASLLAEFKKLLEDMYNKTAAQMAASFAEFLKVRVGLGVRVGVGGRVRVCKPP